MEIRFDNKKLEKLYTAGKSSKYKLEKKVFQSFFETVAVLEAAKNIYDLWSQPSLKFEKLENHENRYSVRLDRKYRLEMTIEWRNEIRTIGIIVLDEITNHYGD